ncbi:MAG: glycosyltransferase [Candidatus Taylorbacteria bacterium]|nr:glycosyltransferase [Candidatus Taylorbacteria bacterium]
MAIKIQCTIGILTFNSERTIKETLESVKNFSEIIICDGGSTDETLSLARAYGARIIVQDPEYKNRNNQIVDFAGVRNQMLAVTNCQWFFSLDSDELMTQKLEMEIEVVVSSKHPATTFWVPRKYTLSGEVVDCAATYPTKQMRFFHLGAVNGFIKTIHERIEVKQGSPVSSLENFMLVPMNPDPLFHRMKWSHYVDLELVRRQRISFYEWLLLCLENSKISLLFIYRYARNLFFCKGKKIPWSLERERHIYHIDMCKRLAPFKKNKNG